jgi:hypothetical protein
MHFSQENIGLTEEYDSVPSYVALFRKFWNHETLRKVCRETNRYAGSLDENEIPRGQSLYGNEKVAQYESILGKVGRVLLLQYDIWLIYAEKVFGIVEVFACYRPCRIR